MKKIMFNDKYSLTQAVLEGRKTQTRRIVPLRLFDVVMSEDMFKITDKQIAKCLSMNSPYKVGEEVAVAQRYSDIRLPVNYKMVGDKVVIKKVDFLSPKGWKNKMFVKAEYMPHRIKITNIRVERLQDISEEDCLKEGY